MFDYDKYTEYFQNMATQYIKIGHTTEKPRFFEGDPEEVITTAAKDISYKQPIVILEPFLLETADEGADNHENIWSADFMVLERFNRRDNDYAELKRIYRDTLYYAQQFRNRIKLDRDNFHYQDNDLIRHFSMGSARFMKVDIPVGGYMYGARCELKFHAKGFDYLPDEWLDGNPYIPVIP